MTPALTIQKLPKICSLLSAGILMMGLSSSLCFSAQDDSSFMVRQLLNASGKPIAFETRLSSQEISTEQRLMILRHKKLPLEITFAPETSAHFDASNHQQTLNLEKGILWVLNASSSTLNEAFMIKTPVGLIKVPFGDFILEYRPSTKYLTLCINQGNVLFSSNNGGSPFILKRGQKLVATDESVDKPHTFQRSALLAALLQKSKIFSEEVSNGGILALGTLLTQYNREKITENDVVWVNPSALSAFKKFGTDITSPTQTGTPPQSAGFPSLPSGGLPSYQAPGF